MTLRECSERYRKDEDRPPRPAAGWQKIFKNNLRCELNTLSYFYVNNTHYLKENKEMNGIIIVYNRRELNFMSMKITFNKIQKENIFCDDLVDFQKNNTIEFSDRGIAVLYGPNGVGKTSLCKVLDCEQNSFFNIEIDGNIYTNENPGLFHKIADQNGRNIIKGNTEDFLLGDNIRLERALKSEIDNLFKTLLEDKNNVLKSQFNISKKTSKLIPLVSDDQLKNYIKDIANNQSKGKGIDIDDFITKVNSLEQKDTPEFNVEKLDFLIKDLEESKSIVTKIISIGENDISPNTKINELEENDYAIQLLTKFISKNQCVVCDHEINPTELLEMKRTNRSSVFESLDENVKPILEAIAEQIKDKDPFEIKAAILRSIEQGNKTIITELQNEFTAYMKIVEIQINNLFATSLSGTDLSGKHEQYKSMLETRLEISDADAMFIEKIVSENIEKPIKLVRDENNNIKLLLGETEFINRDRSELHLSTGEQNFISLTFEFLKAKNSSCQFIVLDDPISSFDSIYKSKIAYAILKFLEDKKIIILTHNTDLIRLLECQLKNCFNLYIFNNIQNENNGFIRVNKSEQDILLYLDKMTSLFRREIFSEIKDYKAYLISMIPFMRGYAQIIDDIESKNRLTKLMHGYETEKINITEIYNRLFGKHCSLVYKCEISVEDILNMNIDTLEILNTTDYTLLKKTLEHSLCYLFLRLKVEKTLVDVFGVNVKRYDQLGQIINAALNDHSHLNERVYLTSRKTLLNEFNHFEGNMNIFQPAIDISDTVLRKEKEGILSVLNTIAS